MFVFRSSIPVESNDVELDFNVTTYESKLGDPKPEDPPLVRSNIEPEKIKTINNIDNKKVSFNFSHW